MKPGDGPCGDAISASFPFRLRSADAGGAVRPGSGADAVIRGSGW
jgi:hypothetical protein